MQGPFARASESGYLAILQHGHLHEVSQILLAQGAVGCAMRFVLCGHELWCFSSTAASQKTLAISIESMSQLDVHLCEPLVDLSIALFDKNGDIQDFLG